MYCIQLPFGLTPKRNSYFLKLCWFFPFCHVSYCRNVMCALLVRILHLVRLLHHAVEAVANSTRRQASLLKGMTLSTRQTHASIRSTFFIQG